MVENIEKVLERGQRIQVLEVKAEDMAKQVRNTHSAFCAARGLLKSSKFA